MSVVSDRTREQLLIWIAALSLFAALVVQARRAFPEPFAEARAQLSVERRDLAWAAQGAGPLVQLASFGDIAPLRFVTIRHEDLLERNSAGLR